MTLPLTEKCVQDRFLDLFNRDVKETVILISDTGTGKTTQIPKIIMLDQKRLSNESLVVCTQPRRIAAISVCKRVSAELKDSSSLVGYSVRFDDRTNINTRLVYSTDGVLLREAVNDPLLSRYGVVIIDEAHERSLNTDIVFSVVKRAKQLRETASIKAGPLKIVIMSATIDPSVFQDFFAPAVLAIAHGVQHNLTVYYLKVDDFCLNSSAQRVTLVADTVQMLHKSEHLSSGILVFLTGQDEIETVFGMLLKTLNEHDMASRNGRNHFALFKLYAALPLKMQMKAFERVKGVRKIVLATNIAETSVTINGISIVVDTGVAKIKHMNCLCVSAISRAEARQRAGRACRTSDGICIRLYPKDFYKEKMFDYQTAEILRTDLSFVVLNLLKLNSFDQKKKNINGFDYLVNFNWFEKQIGVEMIQAAVDKLVFLQAINSSCVLEKTGEVMAALPLQPEFSRALVSVLFMERIDRKVFESVLILCLMLSEEQIFYTDKLVNGHSSFSFSSVDGDIFMLLNMYNAYLEVQILEGMKKNDAKDGVLEFCKKYKVNMSSLKNVNKGKAQITGIVKKLGFCSKMTESVENKNFKSEIIYHFVQGFKMNLCKFDGEVKNGRVVNNKGYKLLYNNKNKYKHEQLSLHPSSCLSYHVRGSLAGNYPKYIFFCQLIFTTKNYMKYVSVVDEETLQRINEN